MKIQNLAAKKKKLLVNYFYLAAVVLLVIWFFSFIICSIGGAVHFIFLASTIVFIIGYQRELER